MTPTRLEAFSDGVIAIIITIMVLELKVPHQNGLAGLLSVSPILAIYALSFLFVGTYWINHHALIHRLRSVDTGVLWANLIFLFGLSLLPFFTDYLGEKEVSAFAAALYSTSLLLPAFGFLLLRMAIHRHLRQDNEYTPADRRSMWTHLLSIALYSLAIPAAWIHPWAALGLSFLMTVIWVVPGFGLWVSSLFYADKSSSQA